MTELIILKEKLNKILNAENKTEISEFINSLKEHKTSDIFKKNITILFIK